VFRVAAHPLVTRIALRGPALASNWPLANCTNWPVKLIFRAAGAAANTVMSHAFSVPPPGQCVSACLRATFCPSQTVSAIRRRSSGELWREVERSRPSQGATVPSQDPHRCAPHTPAWRFSGGCCQASRGREAGGAGSLFGSFLCGSEGVCLANTHTWGCRCLLTGLSACTTTALLPAAQP
jgi:hypothetical protein